MLSLDKQRPESSSSEEVQAVTPWVVSGNVDHEKVIEKFGCDRIDESLIAVAGDKNCQWHTENLKCTRNNFSGNWKRGLSR
ncbi:unnamed protein product [Brassica rapa subsp. trilocularis]|uniref:(rape) hypothetical protein n=2 Tax=Brassica TaxID=3705 RepID=A0A816WWJ0_BRANA|nr:unnamed protein product [Brassica napus]